MNSDYNRGTFTIQNSYVYYGGSPLLNESHELLSYTEPVIQQSYHVIVSGGGSSD